MGHPSIKNKNGEGERECHNDLKGASILRGQSKHLPNQLTLAGLLR